MPTHFDKARAFMRALLADYGLEDVQQPDYSNALLNQHINLALAILNDSNLDSVEIPEVEPTEVIPGTPADYEFTTDLNRSQLAILALRATRTVINNQPNEFAYRTPVHSVSRKGGVKDLRLFIDEALVQLEGKHLAMASQTDLEAILGAPAQLLRDLQNAYDRSLTI